MAQISSISWSVTATQPSVQSAGSFSGGIVNATDAVIAGHTGIAVGIGATTHGLKAVSSFGGGIANQGLIMVSAVGISVNGV